MTRFVVDAGVAIRLVTDESRSPRSTSSSRRRSFARRRCPPARGRPARRPAGQGRADRLARIGRLPIRLLGDGVLRRRAWDIAEQLGWASTYDAEYVALTQLQADAFVTLDAELARRLEGIVATASIDDLR